MGIYYDSLWWERVQNIIQKIQGKEDALIDERQKNIISLTTESDHNTVLMPNFQESLNPVMHGLQLNKKVFINLLQTNEAAATIFKIFGTAVPIGIAMYPFYVHIVLVQMRGNLNNPGIGFFMLGIYRSIITSLIKIGLTTQNQAFSDAMDKLIQKFFPHEIKNNANILKVADIFLLATSIATLETTITQPNFIKKSLPILERFTPMLKTPGTFWSLYTIGFMARGLRNFTINSALLTKEHLAKKLPDDIHPFVVSLTVAGILSPFATVSDHIAREQLRMAIQAAQTGEFEKPTMIAALKKIGPNKLFTGNMTTTAATCVSLVMFSWLNEQINNILNPESELVETKAANSNTYTRTSGVYSMFNFKPESKAEPPPRPFNPIFSLR